MFNSFVSKIEVRQFEVGREMIFNADKVNK